MVMPSGVPSSSLREYRFPMDAEESSILLGIPRRRSLVVSLEMKGLKSAWLERGTMRTLVGATMGGKERTWVVSRKK